MALIICKECGKEFSDHAKACPNCGCPVEFSTSHTEGEIHIEKAEETPKKKKGLVSGALGMAAKGLKNAANVADDISDKGGDSEYVKKAKGFVSGVADKTVSAAKKVGEGIKDKVEDTIDDYKEREKDNTKVEKQGKKSITELAHMQADDAVDEKIEQEFPENTLSERVDLNTAESNETTKEELDLASTNDVQDESDELIQLPAYGSAPEKLTQSEKQKNSKKPNKNRIWALIGLAAIAVICFIVLLITGDKTIAMKDVSHMDAVKALSTLEEAGFTQEHISFVDKDGKEIEKATSDWVVESQNQEAGKEISPEEEIILSVTNPKQEAEEKKAAEEKKKAEAEKKKAEEEKKKEEKAKKEAKKKAKEEAENKKKAEKAAKKEALKQKQKKIKALEGLRVVDAKATAKEMGYTFTYLHSYTREDFTEQVRLNPEWADYEEWLIMGVEAVDAKAKTAIILINAEENQAYLDNKEQLQKKLESKFPKADAWRAMEAYGKDNYPKFNLKEMGNEIAATARDSSTWFLKTYCSYTDVYGVKWKNREVEAQITGTPNNPVVEYFLIH